MSTTSSSGSIFGESYEEDKPRICHACEDFVRPKAHVCTKEKLAEDVWDYMIRIFGRQ